MSANSTTIRDRLAAVDWKYWLLLLLVFSPAIVLALLMKQNAVNCPAWDDWERVPIVEKWENGTLTFQDLYAPHLEHRMVSQRVIMLLMHTLSGGDLRWENAATFLMGLLAAIGVWKLSRLTLERSQGSSEPAWGLQFAVNLVLFSPLQCQSLLWAICNSIMLSLTCLVWGIYAAVAPWRWWVRLAACGVLGIIGTHSYSSGMLIWPAIFVAVLLYRREKETVRQKAVFLGVLTAVAAVIAWCYFTIDYQNTADPTHAYGQRPGEKPPGLLHIDAALENPGRTVKYFLVLLGNPLARVFGRDHVLVAQWIGTGLLGLYTVAGVWFLASWRDRRRWNAAAPWVVIGGTVLVTASIITLARVDLTGITRASIPLYISIADYLIVSLMFLAAIACRAFAPVSWRPAVPVLIGFFAGIQVWYWIYGAGLMDLYRISRHQEQVELMFINHWEPDRVQLIDSTLPFAKHGANVLNEIGALDPPLVESLDLAQFRPNKRPRPTSTSAVEKFERVEDGRIRIAGYSWLGGDDHRPADGVLLSYDTAEGPVLFGLAAGGRRMRKPVYHYDLDLIDRERTDPRDWWRWEKTFDPAELLPAGQSWVVKAWAFNVRNRRAYRIGGAWEVSPDGEIREVEAPRGRSPKG